MSISIGFDVLIFCEHLKDKNFLSITDSVAVNMDKEQITVV